MHLVVHESCIQQHDALAMVEYHYESCLYLRPFGPRSGSTHGARKSQKRIVSPPKIISPLGERIKVLT